MSAPPLVGRDFELRTLTGLIDQVDDHGAAITVLGEPGIGKSSLLRAAADYARRAGLRVLMTTGIEAEAQLPFTGLHHLLRPVLAAASRLPAPQRQALSAAFGIDDEPRPEPFLIALAALNLLAEAAAERPVLMVADDVQWLDRPSQDVLVFLVRRVSADPVLLLGAVRTGYELAFTTVGLPPLELRGLDDASARDVLAQHGDGLGYADQELILREAAGNPLALVELLLAIRAVAASGLELLPHLLPLTARLERAFAARLGGLPQPARDAVLIAAVDYSDDVREILAGAAALAGHDVGVAALEPAVAVGLIRFDDLHVRFGHPLVRSAVLHLEAVTRRYAANAALAEVLVDEPYRRSWHRAQSISGQDDAVADELEAMHVVSLRRGSAAEAIWALERSAQLTTDSAARGRCLLLAAEHAFGLGRAELVDQLLTKAARTDLSRLQRARMEWLREIFNDGVPGDAGRVFGMAAHAIGDPVRATDFFGRAETKLRQQGRLGLLSQVLTMQVLDHLELGDWDRAAAAVEEERRLAQDTGQPIWDIGSLSLRAMAVALRGGNDQAQAIAAQAEHSAGGRHLNDLLACVQLARGYGLLSTGQYAEAYEELRRVFDPADPAFHLTERFHGVMYLAEAAVHAGLADDAREVITALQADTAITPSPTLHRELSYARAVLAVDEQAAELFAAAMREDLTRWPWLRARLELAYGRWLRRQRRAAQARQPLRSALITFEIIGAASWAGQARSELRASGERTPAQHSAQQSSLSAQELQIARLAAEGLSNREIGERLYLSPRTVGSHLYRIFPKLAVTSRAQLAARLGTPVQPSMQSAD